jgi:hypothetical protein
LQKWRGWGVTKGPALNLSSEFGIVSERSDILAGSPRWDGLHVYSRTSFESEYAVGVQNDLMPLLDKKLGRHFAEAISRSRDEIRDIFVLPDRVHRWLTQIKWFRSFVLAFETGMVKRDGDGEKGQVEQER